MTSDILVDPLPLCHLATLSRPPPSLSVSHVLFEWPLCPESKQSNKQTKCSSTFLSTLNSIFNFDLNVLQQGSQTQFHTRAIFWHKKGSRAALRGKMSTRSTIGGIKCLYTTKNCYLSNNLSNFKEVAGRTNTSVGSHMSRGPRLWDPCPTERFTDFDKLNMLMVVWL